MKARAFVILTLILIGGVAPVHAADDERYSYITVEDVFIRLDNGTAAIHVNYSVDESTRFIFFLLGKQDLKNKVLKILNYENARIQRIDLSSADITVEDVVQSQGRGVYWYPSHEFNVVIPRLTVQSPQTTRSFNNTKIFPEGMGFFGDPLPEPVTGL